MKRKKNVRMMAKKGNEKQKKKPINMIKKK